MMIYLINNFFFWFNIFIKIIGDLKKNFDIVSIFFKLLYIFYLLVIYVILIEKEGMKVIFSWLFL